MRPQVQNKLFAAGAGGGLRDCEPCKKYQALVASCAQNLKYCVYDDSHISF